MRIEESLTRFRVVEEQDATQIDNGGDAEAMDIDDLKRFLARPRTPVKSSNGLSPA